MVSTSASLQEELENMDKIIEKYTPLAEAAQTQADMNITSGWFYTIWDTELNSLWSRFSDKADAETKYIGQQKAKLPPAILDAPTLLEKFDKQRKVFMQIMRNKIGEYEAENRLPDEELNRFYDRMKQEVVRFVYSLESER